MTDWIVNAYPLIIKIELTGESSVKAGGILKNGRFVGVMKDGICLFDVSHRTERRPDEVNTIFWGGKTTPLTALFLNRERALDCFKTLNRENWDPRWREETEEVIRAIGDNHPIFILGRDLSPLA
ncbi:hypothetical protein JW698_03355 [Candidatus Wolfebacteria bacterium]|nr:hypothetical protein [Candidatus Wolfebacteria bacterium]